MSQTCKVTAQLTNISWRNLYFPAVSPCNIATNCGFCGLRKTITTLPEYSEVSRKNSSRIAFKRGDRDKQPK